MALPGFGPSTLDAEDTLAPFSPVISPRLLSGNEALAEPSSSGEPSILVLHNRLLLPEATPKT
jgi:hypothetical protein